MVLFWILLADSPRQTIESMPLGLEWMPIASILIPAVLLAIIVYIGSEKAVH